MTPKSLTGLFLGLMLAIVLITPFILGNITFPTTPPGIVDVGAVKWEYRSYEVLLQGFILLAGVMAILLLLGSRKYRDDHP